MADKQVEIKGLNLVIGKKEIELTVAEAKKLHQALDEMFKKEVIKVITEHHYDRWWWNYPQYTYINCGGTTSTDLGAGAGTLTNTATSKFDNDTGYVNCCINT